MEDRKTHLQVIFGLIFGVLALFIIIRLFAVPIANDLQDDVEDDTDIVDEDKQDEDDTTDENDYIEVEPDTGYQPSAYVQGVPSIKLKGYSVVNVQVGADYSELGAVATDTKYGDISGDIIITGTVDTTTFGTFILTYTVTNSDNVVASVIRQVNVTDLIPPELEFVGMGGTTGPDLVATKGESFDLLTLVSASDNYDHVDVIVSAYHRLSDDEGWSLIEGSNIDLGKIGFYRVYFAARDAFGNMSQLDDYFEVKVVDNVVPNISSTGGTTKVEINSDFDEYSILSANDNIEVAKVVAMEYQYSLDGTAGTYAVIDVTSLPKDRLGYYKVKYVAMDTSGNISSELVVTFRVIDNTDPTYTLTSTNSVILDKTDVSTILDDSSYYTVSDNSGVLPVISKAIKTSVDGTIYDESLLTEIDLINEGYYKVTYTVTDGSGNFVTFDIDYHVVDRKSRPSVTLTLDTDALPNIFSVSIDDNFDTITDFEYIIVDSLPVADIVTGLVDYSIYDGSWMNGTVSTTFNGRDTTGSYYIIIKASDSDGNVTYEHSIEYIES